MIGGTHKIASGYCCRCATRMFETETAPRTLPDLSDLRVTRTFRFCIFLFFFFSCLTIATSREGERRKRRVRTNFGEPSIVPRSLPARSYGDVLLHVYASLLRGYIIIDEPLASFYRLVILIMCWLGLRCRTYDYRMRAEQFTFHILRCTFSCRSRIIENSDNCECEIAYLS